MLEILLFTFIIIIEWLLNLNLWIDLQIYYNNNGIIKECLDNTNKYKDINNNTKKNGKIKNADKIGKLR